MLTPEFSCVAQSPCVSTLYRANGGCVNDSEAVLTNGASLGGAAVMFERGACAFSAMVRAAASANAKAVYVLNIYNKTEVEPGATNVSDYDEFHGPVCRY